MKLTLTKSRIGLKKISVFLTFLLIFVAFFALVLAVLAQFKPVFQEKAVMLAKQRATEIINSTIIDVFSQMESCDYININKNESGEISSVSSDTARINRLRALVSQAVSKKCSIDEDYYVHIPIGSLTKYPVLQGMGYRIPVIVSLDGVTKTDFQDEFTDAGINQVKNKNYIVVSARISIISSIMTVSEIVTTKIPVTETIIVGDVPNYYGSGLGVIGR